jgi:ATP-dependent HslUV protease ATP-binding subunit HslU
MAPLSDAGVSTRRDVPARVRRARARVARRARRGRRPTMRRDARRARATTTTTTTTTTTKTHRGERPYGATGPSRVAKPPKPPTKRSTIDVTIDVTPADARDGRDAREEDGRGGLTPERATALLDKHIVGQTEAKRACAVALRNRWRRHRIGKPMRDEIVPKNILMIGPTGCGKTEIARRLAKITDSPFVKVEATKFTEVGFHGRDVDQIIRDLVDNGIAVTKQKMRAKFEKFVEELIENKILDFVCGEGANDETREAFRTLYRDGTLDDRTIEVELPDSGGQNMKIDPSGGPIPIHELVIKVDKLFGNRKSTSKRKMTVAECKPLIEEMEFDNLLSAETIAKEAITAVENDGIVFIDEIDKIVSSSDYRHGADASSEGVQRDLLPIIEGSVVSTKHGNVNTDHILFIASGAFHSAKPSDMLAELQGRLPIRVELKGLTERDLYRILTEPEMNMIAQQKALMKTEGIDLEFTNEAIEHIASIAAKVNKTVDNIGARRLHTVLERIVEDLSFDAPERYAKFVAAGGKGELQVKIGVKDIDDAIGNMLKQEDLSRFVL